MHADLDLLCISVYCTADDLLPARPRQRSTQADRRRDRDALCVAQVLMGIPSDRRFLRAARRQLGHLFPYLPARTRCTSAGSGSPTRSSGWSGSSPASAPAPADDLLLLDSTPVECGRSLETSRRSQLADACGYGYCKSHSRWFWGMRLHLVCAPDGTPRAATLVAADRPEREVALPPAARVTQRRRNDHLRQRLRRPRLRDRRPTTRRHDRPARTQERTPTTTSRSPRSDNGSSRVFFTCKDLLTLERHGARTLNDLRARIATRLLALAACIRLNHQLGRPSRAIADYTA